MYGCYTGEISRSLCVLIAIYAAVVAYRIADILGLERPLAIATGVSIATWFVSSFAAATLLPL